MAVDPQIVISVAAPTAVFTAGVAWGVVKVTLNGTKGRVENIEALMLQILQRLSRIEGHLDVDK